MKIILDRAALSSTLSFVKNSIPKKEIEPILNNLYIKTIEGNKIQVVSTDLDLMAVAYMNAQIEGEGELTIPGSRLISLVSKLTGDRITLDSDGVDIAISCGTYSGVFKTAGTDSYPPIMEILNKEKLVSFPRTTLVQSFARIGFAVNHDEARKNLMAIQITDKGMVSTNGKVTALYRENFNIPELYISSNCLNDLVSVVNASKAENVEVYSDEAYLVFKLGEDIFFTRRTNVKFPDVFGKIDAPTLTGNTKKLKFKVKELKAAISRIALTSSEETKAIKLKVTALDKVEISSEDKGFKGVESISATAAGFEVGFEVLFNYDYILEILTKHAADDIELKFNDNIRLPVRVDEGKFTAFLMQLVGA